MFVNRADVNCRDSIHRESCVTGAKAMASSDDGSGAPSAGERTKRSRDGPAVIPGRTGFQTVAGASVGGMATLRGPVRRSRYGASVRGHVSAACCRSAAVIVTCINFSASAKVAGDTAGPDTGPVPNVGGAPAVPDVGWCVACVDCDGGASLHATAAVRTPRGALIRNWRRVFIRLFCAQSLHLGGKLLLIAAA